MTAEIMFYRVLNGEISLIQFMQWLENIKSAERKKGFYLDRYNPQ